MSLGAVFNRQAAKVLSLLTAIRLLGAAPSKVFQKASFSSFLSTLLRASIALSKATISLAVRALSKAGLMGVHLIMTVAVLGDAVAA